jgi:hypothetical protein
MRNKKSWIFTAAIVAVAMLFAYYSDTGDGAAYLHSSTGERGASLLYDTLRHMDYNVGVSRRPLTSQTNNTHVYIIIQPRYIFDDSEIAEIFEWVQNGGRLIFLCRRFPTTVLDREIKSDGVNIGNHIRYRYGNGEIITGKAENITNGAMIKNSSYGQFLQTTLDRWHREREIENIFFAEYYHGSRVQETFIGRLPFVMQLIAAQILIISVITIWHLSKRFGNPIPLYEEIEREENEYVHALARVYMETERKRK